MTIKLNLQLLSFITMLVLFSNVAHASGDDAYEAFIREREYITKNWIEYEFTKGLPKFRFPKFNKFFHIQYVNSNYKDKCAVFVPKYSNELHRNYYDNVEISEEEEIKLENYKVFYYDIYITRSCISDEDITHFKKGETYLLNTVLQKELYNSFFKIRFKKDILISHPELTKLLNTLNFADYFFKDESLKVNSIKLWTEMTFQYLNDPLLYSKNIVAFKFLKENFFEDQVFFSDIPTNFKMTKYEFLKNKFIEINEYCELKNRVPKIEILIASKGEGYGMAGHSFLKIKDCDINPSNDLVFSFGAITDPRMSKLSGIIKAFFGFLPLSLSEKQFFEILKIYTIDEKRNIYSRELNISLAESKNLMDLILKRFKALNTNSQNYSILTKNCTTEIKKLIQLAIDRDLKSNLISQRMPTKFMNYLFENELLTEEPEKVYLAQ